MRSIDDLEADILDDLNNIMEKISSGCCGRSELSLIEEKIQEIKEGMDE